MYTILSAVGVPKGLFRKWESIALTVKVKDIFANYRRAQITLRTPDPAKTVYLEIDEIAAEFGTYDGTIAQMLASIGDRSLPVADSG